MKEHTENCVDGRGREFVMDILAQLDEIIAGVERILADWKMTVSIKEEDLDLLAQSVNQERLGNHPIRLSESAIRNIYADMH